MTDYFVGPGGNNGNSGTSWANRKLTLNGVEDIAVTAGDTVYVGPGVYRETLTVDVSGSSGSPITYIADVSGVNTDGVGGVVRITGSDDDQTTTRSNCISGTSFDYRTFRGFHFDLPSVSAINNTNGTNWIVEDCAFSATATSIRVDGASQSDFTCRRCVFIGCSGNHIRLTHTSVVTGTNHLIENCLFISSAAAIARIDRIGDTLFKNCLFFASGSNGIDVTVTAGTGAGQFTSVNNSIFTNTDNTALVGTVTGDIVEDYNTFFNNSTDRANTATGSNSQTYPPLFALPILLAEFRLVPWFFSALSEWSPIAAIAGTGEATDDIFGIARPTTSAKKSWGTTQFNDFQRETTTVRSGTAAAQMPDADRRQFIVPAGAAISTTVSVYVRREANYAGTNPQMIIKQPGQADRTTTDVGSSGAWNQLSDTFTPAATPDYFIVELVSNNTATSGSYATYFDDLEVS